MLTIEELKALKRYDWIWVILTNLADSTKYVQIAGQTGDSLLYYAGGYPTRLAYTDYGTKWLACKNKEEATLQKLSFGTFGNKIAKILDDLNALYPSKLDYGEYSLLFSAVSELPYLVAEIINGKQK